jgi:hypothetical protein
MWHAALLIEGGAYEFGRTYDYCDCIESRKSELAFVLLSLSSNSSIASVGESCESTLRSTMMQLKSGGANSNSSLRVPDLLM